MTNASSTGGGPRAMPGNDDKPREAGRKRSLMSSGRAALIISVIGLVLIILFIVPRGQNRSGGPAQSGAIAGQPTRSAGSQAAESPPPLTSMRSYEPLAEAKVVTGTPINTVDPTSGKPIVGGIVSTYKGYTIGHCCEVSKRQWEAHTNAKKDADVRRFLNLK